MKPVAKHLKQLLLLILAVWAMTFALPCSAQDSLAALTAKANEAEQKKQYPLALLYYDQCVRLTPGDAATLARRNACAAACASMNPRQANAEERQAIAALRDRLEASQNSHDLQKILACYSADYINNDGFTMSTLRQALSDTLTNTPDLHCSIQVDNVIPVSADLAVCKVITTSTGSRYVSNLRGALASQISFFTLLRKEQGNWLLVGDYNYVDNGSLGFGDAQAVVGSLVAPNTVEQGSKITAKGAIRVPFGFYVNGTLTCLENQYPPPQTNGSWQISQNGMFEKSFDASDSRNHTVLGTFQILRGMDNMMVGAKTLSTRVNVVATGSKKQTWEVLASLFDRAQLAQTPPASTDSNATQIVSTNSASKKDTPIRDKWALIIGISNFKNPEYNLKVAAKDAQDFCNYLVNEAQFRRDHILMLLNEKATRENIMTAFGDQFLPAVCEPGDMIVVYVSTHGTPKTVDKGGRNYIVAYDTDASKLYATGVDMDELYKRIREGVKTDRALIVLDTCYSGAGVPGSRGLHRGDNFDANEVAQGCGQLVISSSSPNERSWESRVSPNGVFTKYLVETLKEKKGSDLKTAFAEVQKKVEWEVKSVFGEKQTPQLGGNWEGKELILSLPPTENRPVLNPELLQLINAATPAKNTATPVKKQQ